MNQVEWLRASSPDWSGNAHGKYVFELAYNCEELEGASVLRSAFQTVWVDRSPDDVSSVGWGDDGHDNTQVPAAATSILSVAPNPFNPSTTISYSVPREGFTSLEIYSLTGRRIVSLVAEVRPAGVNAIVWSGRDDAGRSVASGIYFVRVKTPEGSASKKLVLLK